MHPHLESKTPSSESGKTWRDMAVNFANEISLSLHSEGSRITHFIDLKNPSSSAGFEPENIESNGKHNNHWTTENDFLILNCIESRRDEK
jgi:hypothetical protein